MSLTGCEVGPDFTPPDAPAVDAYTSQDRTAPPSPGDGETTQRLVVDQHLTDDWWMLFRSPAVNEVVTLAVADNRTLAQARASLAQSRATVAQAAGGLWPQVDFRAGASRQKASLAAEGINVPPTFFNLYTLGPSVSFDLDLFGGNKRRVEQQAALADQQDYQLSAAWLTLTGNAATQLVNIAADRDLIKVIEDIIADDERNLQLIQTETRAGELTRIDVSSAASQLAADRALLPPLRQELNVAEDALALLVGKAPAQWHAPALRLDDIALPASLPLSVPSRLVHQRPDILAAEAQLHAASAAIGVATAQQYPDINLGASVGQAALSIGTLFTPMANVWALMGSLSAPIFHGGTLEAQKKGAIAAYEGSLAGYQQTVLQSFQQVADVLNSLTHSAELLAEQRRAVDAAQQSLDLMRTTFSYGTVTLLQILDAQRQLEQARLGYVRARAQRLRDTIQLMVAMGGGWREWRARTMEASAEGTAPSPRVVRTNGTAPR